LTQRQNGLVLGVPLADEEHVAHVIAELSGGDLLVSGSLQLFVGVVDPSLNG